MKKPKILRRRLPAAALSVAAAALILGIIRLVWYCALPVTVDGIDISHYQGAVGWAALKAGGDAGFVYIKATEGRAYVDPDFAANWQGAAENGIPAGAYHYYSSSSTGADQAANFIREVPKESGRLPPAVDVEEGALEQKGFRTELAAYIRLVAAHYGQRPVIYVPYGIYRMISGEYRGYRFWIIDYKNASPRVGGWTFHQYSGNGSAAGIAVRVDLDRFRGSRMKYDGLFSK